MRRLHLFRFLPSSQCQARAIFSLGAFALLASAGASARAHRNYCFHTPCAVACAHSSCRVHTHYTGCASAHAHRCRCLYTPCSHCALAHAYRVCCLHTPCSEYRIPCSQKLLYLRTPCTCCSPRDDVPARKHTQAHAHARKQEHTSATAAL